MTKGGIVYSTNKNLKIEEETYSTIDKSEFIVSVCFEKKS